MYGVSKITSEQNIMPERTPRLCGGFQLHDQL